LPAPGIYFGAAVNPLRFESSAWMFRHYREHLDAAVLGILEVDGAGNVNVSRRGPAAGNYVGPGGFPTIVDCADTVIFIGAWMSGARWAVRGEQLQMRRPGRPKFVAEVSEVTFSGPRAFAAGKQVYYVTHVGVMRLREHGLELIWRMPGVDVERDIIAHSNARIAIADDLREADASVVTGRGFELDWTADATD
jgi:propionate CoA-transferase